jgi:hypothetical protein
VEAFRDIAAELGVVVYEVLCLRVAEGLLFWDESWISGRDGAPVAFCSEGSCRDALEAIRKHPVCCLDLLPLDRHRSRTWDDCGENDQCALRCRLKSKECKSNRNDAFVIWGGRTSNVARVQKRS